MTNDFQVKSYVTLFQEVEDEWRRSLNTERLLEAQIKELEYQLQIAKKNTERHQAEARRAAQWLLDNDPDKAAVGGESDD